MNIKKINLIGWICIMAISKNSGIDDTVDKGSAGIFWYLFWIGAGLIAGYAIYRWIKNGKCGEDNEEDEKQIFKIIDSIRKYFDRYLDYLKFYSLSNVYEPRFSVPETERTNQQVDKVESIGIITHIDNTWSLEEEKVAVQELKTLIKELSGVDCERFNESDCIIFIKGYYEIKAKRDALKSIKYKIHERYRDNYNQEVQEQKRRLKELIDKQIKQES